MKVLWYLFCAFLWAYIVSTCFMEDLHINMENASTESEKKKAKTETIIKYLLPSLIGAVLAAMFAVFPQFAVATVK